MMDSTDFWQGFSRLCERGEISDFFVEAGQPLRYLRYGSMTADPKLSITKETFMEFISKIGLDLNASNQDFGWGQPYGRFRVNMFKTEGRHRLVLRLLPKDIPNPSQLRIPEPFLDYIKDLKQGLVLFCGPTGSGKSTSNASLLEHVFLKERSIHLLTLEDPIEYALGKTSPTSLISQRQIGVDVESFADGLYYGLRQAPQIIYVGEIRDTRTAEIALSAAETGHLLLSTMHTASCDQTVQRFLQMIPSDRIAQAQGTLAAILKAVVCQRLIPREDGKGRFAIHEVMLQTIPTRNYIESGNWGRIPNELEMGRKFGHQTFKYSLEKAVQEGLVTNYIL
jgi:twitching motility protein PilT